MPLTPTTVASWVGRLDEEGPDALVQTPEPVNQYPAFVAYLVRRLKVLCPIMGKARIANVLCRAGLHLSATTVGRMLKERPRWRSVSKAVHSGRSIRAPSSSPSSSNRTEGAVPGREVAVLVEISIASQFLISPSQEAKNPDENPSWT